MFNNLITKFAEFVIKKPAPFLRYTTAVVYLISTIAQSVGLKINKDIPAKEKNFLIVQEMLSGALELVTFMTIATGLENFGAKLVEKGIVVGSEAAKGNPKFGQGMAMLFSLIGTVLAFNLVTPLLRNPLAALLQKHVLKKKINDPEQLTIPILPKLNLNPNIKISTGNPFAQFNATMQTGNPYNNGYANRLTFRGNGLGI